MRRPAIPLPPNTAILKTYGLIGKSLAHSFSAAYFTEKFKREGLPDHVYRLFPLEAIEDLPGLVRGTPDLAGLNVTVPYKQAVMAYLRADPDALAIGAVNTIRIRHAGGQAVLEGFNTDWKAFSESYRAAYGGHREALVLGTGGGARAVQAALRHDGFVAVDLVSRTPQAGRSLGYDALLDGALLASRTLIVNATPAGMYPVTESCPPLPFERLTSSHLVIDLVYNPPETVCMRKARQYGAVAINGLAMLYRQAELSWQIWNAP